MAWFGNPGKSDRLARLAARIDALAERDATAQREVEEIAALRLRAATELHATCAGFVNSLNRMLSRSEVHLDPPEFSPGAFREDFPNLFQLSFRGRILQIAFETTPVPLSTEEFRIPYTMKGELRWFNQDFLERDRIDERLLFYCVEPGPKRYWRAFDVRTYHSGPFDREYLIDLLELLV
jgi:hypothetical protein